MAKKSRSARTAAKRPRIADPRSVPPGALSRIKDTVVTTLADVGRVALRAAGGALHAADRISAAAGRALIDPKLMAVGRKPLARSSSRTAPPTTRRRGRRTA